MRFVSDEYKMDLCFAMLRFDVSLYAGVYDSLCAHLLEDNFFKK